MSSSQLLKAIASRRTIYNLKPTLPASLKIQDIQSAVQEIVKETPTAFNSQSIRAIILTGETHKKAWDSVVKAIDNEDSKRRPQSVRDEAYGSIIFFSDDNVIAGMQKNFPAIAAAFPKFADHSSGAAQIQSWTVLESMGLGCHLQHYNGYLKAALPADIPDTWSIQSQLVFGAPASDAGEKTYIDNEVKTYN